MVRDEGHTRAVRARVVGRTGCARQARGQSPTWRRAGKRAHTWSCATFSDVPAMDTTWPNMPPEMPRRARGRPAGHRDLHEPAQGDAQKRPGRGRFHGPTLRCVCSGVRRICAFIFQGALLQRVLEGPTALDFAILDLSAMCSPRRGRGAREPTDSAARRGEGAGVRRSRRTLLGARRRSKHPSGGRGVPLARARELTVARGVGLEGRRWGEGRGPFGRGFPRGPTAKRESLFSRETRSQ